MRSTINIALVPLILLPFVLAPSEAAGQLPKDLPLWFKLLDTNRDGQVSLFEWREVGKSIEEFRSWDRNNDGLITIEECLSKQRHDPEADLESTTGIDNSKAVQLDKSNVVRSGKMLFTRVWTVNDPLCGKGDGIGPVFNASSCAHCHFKGGLGGSGDLEHNVTTFVRKDADGKVVQGVIHAYATSPKYQETLAHAHPLLAPLVRPSLEQIQEQIQRFPPSSKDFQLSQRNTPALFGAKLIDELPDSVILANERIRNFKGRGPVGRALLLPDGSVGKFGWKAQSPSLLAFVQDACANELGLSNPDHPQPAPLVQVSFRTRGLDLTLEQCKQMAAFIGALPRPVERVPSNSVAQNYAVSGREVFQLIRCADCHVPNMGSLSGVYSDFLLHRMGGSLEGRGSYNSPPRDTTPGEPLADEWRTPPLWGVADSAPYLHDGRAKTLHDAIILHGGQAADSATRYQNLTSIEQELLHCFLNTLRAPG